MEFCKYVNLQNVSAHLTSEINEISKRWAGFTINKRALERAGLLTFPEETIKDHQRIVNALEGKKPTDHKRTISKFTEDEIKHYERVKENKERQETYEKVEKGLKEFEEFLEIVTELKKEIDNQLKK